MDIREKFYTATDVWALSRQPEYAEQRLELSQGGIDYRIHTAEKAITVDTHDVVDGDDVLLGFTLPVAEIFR